MKTIVEKGVALELSVESKKTNFGIAYWRARYSFVTGHGTARLHGVTSTFHASAESAELAALAEARAQGWS